MQKLSSIISILIWIGFILFGAFFMLSGVPLFWLPSHDDPTFTFAACMTCLGLFFIGGGLVGLWQGGMFQKKNAPPQSISKRE